MIRLGLTQEASTSTGKKKHFFKQYEEEVPTTAGLLSTTRIQDIKPKCVFCDKPHSSTDCFLAQKLSYMTNRNG